MRDKVLLTFFFYAFFASFLFAQNKFKAGVVAGLSATQVHGDTYSGFDKAGLYAGAFVKYDFNEKWSAQLELDYIQKGSRKNPEPENGDYVLFLLKVNYIEAPILIQWKHKHFGFEIGASYGALVNSKEANQFGPVVNSIPLQKGDVSALYGFNYYINEHFVVNVRNSNSILPIRKFDIPVYYQRTLSNWFNKGMYNTVMIIAVQYQF